MRMSDKCDNNNNNNSDNPLTSRRTDGGKNGIFNCAKPFSPYQPSLIVPTHYLI